MIEAHNLYGVDYDNIEIVVHPQSIVHSMIETQVKTQSDDDIWPFVRNASSLIAQD